MGLLSNIVQDNKFTPDDVPKFEAKLFFEGAKRRQDFEQFAVLLFLSTVIATYGVIGDSTATVHNLYILDDLAYVSYYSAGFRLYDVSDPTMPRLLDEFDTAPTDTGAGFSGAWGVYPFMPSGHIYVSDRTGGLYVFTLER